MLKILRTLGDHYSLINTQAKIYMHIFIYVFIYNTTHELTGNSTRPDTVYIFI